MDILEMEILNDDESIEFELMHDEESFDSEINFNGEFINSVTAEQIKQAVAEYFEESGMLSAPKAIVKEVTLYADRWAGTGYKYEQVVSIDGVTENSQVDLTPNDEQLAIFYNKKVMLTSKNVGGVVTVSLIGQRLEDDYTIQITITEVSYE